MKNEDKNQKFENEKSDSEESGNESPKIEKDNYEELPSLSNTRSQNERNYNLEKPWKNIEKQKIKSKGTELFIGNLNIETKEEELYELFKKYGEIIDIRIHKNEQTKKCYGFVRFSNKESTQKGTELNLSNFKGRKIKVTKSNENSTLFIGNIRKTWTKNEIESKVRRIFHNVSQIEYFPDPNNQNKNRGFCFAVFNNRKEAVKALNYVNNKNGINIDGIPVTCDWADVMDDDDSNSKQIFLSGLNENVNENDLKLLFNKYGNVTNIVLSKNHLNSKRKDLAFITFENHDQAIKCVNNFVIDKKKIGDENIVKCFHIENDPALINKINISLAFSQQSMQTKKKIKDNRKKINQIKNNFESKNNNNNNNNRNNNSNLKNNNLNEDNLLLNNQNMNNNLNANLASLLTNLQSQLVNQNLMNINSLFPNQLVAMTNLINICKVNPNILQTVANIGNNINNSTNEIKDNNSFKQNNNYLNKKRRNNNPSNHNQDNNILLKYKPNSDIK